jgi:hypothetical protein
MSGIWMFGGFEDENASDECATETKKQESRQRVECVVLRMEEVCWFERNLSKKEMRQKKNWFFWNKQKFDFKKCFVDDFFF